MAIVKMKKVRAAALLSDKQQIIDRLTAAGCVQIEAFDAEQCAEALFSVTDGQEDALNVLSEQSDRLLSVLGILKPYAQKKKKPLFADKPSVTQAEFFNTDAFNAAFAAADGVQQLSAELKDLAAEKKRLEARREEFEPWKNCGIPFDFAGGMTYSVIFGICPSDAPADKVCRDLNDDELAAYAEVISADVKNKYVVLIAHKDDLAEALNRLKSDASFSDIGSDGKIGTAADNIKKISADIELIDARLRKTEALLRAAAEDIPLIERAIDVLSVRKFKINAERDMLFTGRTVCFEGWLTAESETEVAQILSECGCAFEVSDPKPGEKVPIKLKSNKLTDPLNMVTEMYSLPAYDGIDPNGLILPFFTVFFGIMFADLGYGIVLMVAGFFIKKKFKPSGTLGRMMGLIIMCGLTTAVAGIFFGGFFGDAIPVITETFFGNRTDLWRIVDPMKDPISILIFSIVMGAVQIIAGMAVNAYMSIRDGHPLDALFDVGSWWLLFAGIAVMALGHGYLLALCGLAAVVLTQGRHSPTFFGKLIGGLGGLYNIITYASDALSYTRLMALLLATSVVASVINIIASISGNVIVFVVIFTFGHLFNMAVNIIGTYVHAARLQYLEFFGKFYKDGGKAFRPLRIKTKYVNVIKEEN